MEIENEINNNIKIKNEQNNFLNTFLGKTINNAIDIGLRAILPDLIENQIIDIKNALIKNGLNAGIKTGIESTINLGKSAIGIFTGNFENINQVETAIGTGGILDTISSVLDKASNKAYELGYINKTINGVIKKGKNVILDNISNNIKVEMKNQSNEIKQLEKNINKWKTCYNNKNFEGMEKEYNKIKSQLVEIMPLENVIKEARNVENIHNLITNNGYNFEVTELEKDVIKKLN
jgi:hypothetical protein